MTEMETTKGYIVNLLSNTGNIKEVLKKYGTEYAVNESVLDNEIETVNKLLSKWVDIMDVAAAKIIIGAESAAKVLFSKAEEKDIEETSDGISKELADAIHSLYDDVTLDDLLKHTEDPFAEDNLTNVLIDIKKSSAEEKELLKAFSANTVVELRNLRDEKFPGSPNTPVSTLLITLLQSAYKE